MTGYSGWTGLALSLLCVALAACRATPAEGAPAGPEDPGAGIRVTLAQALPHLDGANLKATAVEVTYAPGGSSPPHTHPCAVVGYVAEGSIRTQVQGGPEAVYKAGESFYEAPNGVHVVSANASARVPAKLVAFFVCDHDAPLASDVPAASPK